MTLSPTEIKNLDGAKLRNELKKRGLSTDGISHDVLVQRLMECCLEEANNHNCLANLERSSQQSSITSTSTEMENISGTKRLSSANDHHSLLKCMKKSIESSLKEYICPIGHELPIDPVTAMDGQIYERCEIEEWIETKKGSGRPVTSPLTNKTMGEFLIAAPRVYNAIENLIDEDQIQNDLTESWLERANHRKAEKKEVAELLAKSEAGDAEAMYDLFLWYEYGMKGLLVDKEKAKHFLKKSSDFGYPDAMFKYGLFLVNGYDGFTKNVQYGVLLLGRAACEGVWQSSYILGEWFRLGKFGFPKDSQQTKHYWQKYVSGIESESESESCRLDLEGKIEEVKKWLADHE